jgi:hypothetical protein
MSILTLLVLANLGLGLWVDGVLPRWTRAHASALAPGSSAARHALRCALIALLIVDTLAAQAPVFFHLIETELHVRLGR